MRAVRSSTRGGAATTGGGAGRRSAQPVTITSAATTNTARNAVIVARSIADPGRTVQSGYFGAMRLRRHAAVVVAILLAPLIWNTGPAAQAPASQVPRVVDAGENFDASSASSTRSWAGRG